MKIRSLGHYSRNMGRNEACGGPETLIKKMGSTSQPRVGPIACQRGQMRFILGLVAGQDRTPGIWTSSPAAIERLAWQPRRASIRAAIQADLCFVLYAATGS